MNNDLRKELDLLRKEFLKENNLNSYFEINNGNCYEFSSFVDDNIDSKYGLEELALYELYEVDEKGESIDSVFDKDILFKHIKNTTPLGLTVEQINEMHLVPHLCLTDWNKYYDCECIDGVESIFDLPIYKREFYVLEKYLKDTNNLKNGVIINSDVSIIKEYVRWQDEFFKYTGEFNSSEEFWRNKFPELFIG